MHKCYFHHSPCSKFDTLIQAQARELSHLRQRMREGRGVCHILTQHLGDTTKTFEELLRSTDIDYYMGQSFRDQLSQSISLTQRVSTKISGREWNMPTLPTYISLCFSVTKTMLFITSHYRGSLWSPRWQIRPWAARNTVSQLNILLITPCHYSTSELNQVPLCCQYTQSAKTCDEYST